MTHIVREVGFLEECVATIIIKYHSQLILYQLTPNLLILCHARDINCSYDLIKTDYLCNKRFDLNPEFDIHSSDGGFLDTVRNKSIRTVGMKFYFYVIKYVYTNIFNCILHTTIAININKI